MTLNHVAATALILTFGNVAITTAQGGWRPADADLDLTDDQRAQLQTLDSDMKARLDDIHAQAKAGDIGRDEARTQRQSVFTPEQRQLIEDASADTEDWRCRAPGPGGQRPGGEVFDQLGLSEDQRSQLESMRAEHRRAMDTLRESGDATREDVQQLRTEQREEAEGILDEEQRQQLQQNREQRRQDGQGRARRRDGGGGRSGRGGRGGGRGR